MRSNTILNRVDWVLILLYLMLATIGIAFVYSTVHTPGLSFLDFSANHGKQIIWLLISLVVGFFIIVIDYKFYTTFAYFIFGAIMLILASVLVFGVEINGSKSWFALGPIRFQPAELAKFATALALAKTLINPQLDLTKWSGKFKALIVLMIPIGLILLQKDVGSALVFTGFIFVLHREGLESGYLIVLFGTLFFSIMALLYSPLLLLYFYSLVFLIPIFYNKKAKQPALSSVFILLAGGVFFYCYQKYFKTFLFNNNQTPIIDEYFWLFLPVLIIGVVAYFLNNKKKKWISGLAAVFIVISLYTFSVDFIFNQVLKQHHRNRINLILGKIEDYSGAGYNLYQSKVAIGSGGFSGKGFLQGSQTMLGYVPEQRTDFIFTSIAEQFGFIGSFVLIFLFILLLLRILQVAERQRSKFARVYGYAVAGILFIHFTINIGMTIGLVPVIGIPLPFVSYGGSSLLSFTILLFTLIKFDTERLNVLR